MEQMKESSAQTFVGSWPGIHDRALPRTVYRAAPATCGICLSVSVAAVVTLAFALDSPGLAVLLVFAFGLLILGPVALSCNNGPGLNGGRAMGGAKSRRATVRGVVNCIWRNPRSSFMILGGPLLALSLVPFLYACAIYGFARSFVASALAGLLTSVLIDQYGIGWAMPKRQHRLFVLPASLIALGVTLAFLPQIKRGCPHAPNAPHTLDTVGTLGMLFDKFLMLDFRFLLLPLISGASFIAHFSANAEFARLLHALPPAIFFSLFNAFAITLALLLTLPHADLFLDFRVHTEPSPSALQGAGDLDGVGMGGGRGRGVDDGAMQKSLWTIQKIPYPALLSLLAAAAVGGVSLVLALGAGAIVAPIKSSLLYTVSLGSASLTFLLLTLVALSLNWVYATNLIPSILTTLDLPSHHSPHKPATTPMGMGIANAGASVRGSGIVDTATDAVNVMAAAQWTFWSFVKDGADAVAEAASRVSSYQFFLLGTSLILLGSSLIYAQWLLLDPSTKKKIALRANKEPCEICVHNDSDLIEAQVENALDSQES